MNFNTDIFTCFDKEWALVTAGTKDSFNTMTVSWGGLGTLWSRPVATVYVKPIRYTHQFLDENEYFTVSFYGEECKKALGVLGTLSGKDTNKVEMVNFHPVQLEKGMTFKEAEMTLVCRKLYRQDLDKNLMSEEVVEHYYSTEAEHTMYIGEVVEIIQR